MDPIMPKTYAFDFDGVVAQYDGFKAHDHVTEPVCEVVKAIRILKQQGHTILIYSSRGNEFLKKYCADNDIPVDYINTNPDKQGENPGKPIASVYIEDRAVCYKGQTAEELVDEILNFKVYWKQI